MAGFMKIEGIDGESTDSKHDKWITIKSLSPSGHRSIPEGAKSVQRAAVKRPFKTWSSSAKWTSRRLKLKEACCTGKPLEKIEIDLATKSKGKTNLI